MTTWPEAVEVIDSHTAGEPTRVVVAGWPLPAGDSLEQRRASLLREQDHLRRAVVLEPRGHAALVGALLTPPEQPGSRCGVIFFNNVAALGMCGHGLIGLVRTLEWLGRLQPGEVRVDTPVGTVTALLEADGCVTVRNVPARVHALDVEVEVPGLGRVRGDVAWGGNWFFIAELNDEPLEMARLPRLLAVSQAIRLSLVEAGVTGAGAAEIDHIELVAPGHEADARVFVLCPGGEYDRSPCGTGTSAKLAVLQARGRLSPGQVWSQESVTGGRFEAWLAEHEGRLLPHVRGRAHVTGRATLVFDARDPLVAGIGG